MKRDQTTIAALGPQQIQKPRKVLACRSIFIQQKPSSTIPKWAANQNLQNKS
jgi:hypothetical protein